MTFNLKISSVKCGLWADGLSLRGRSGWGYFLATTIILGLALR
jgi:hypothetical protein